MLTKKEIEHIKSVDLEQLYKVIQEYTDEQNLLFILSNLGRLPAEFDGQLFVPHLQHSNPQIRLWAVKNIGKLSDETYLVTISNIAYGDKDTVVRREAVSTIGRMRTETAIPILISLLSDSNPEIISRFLDS
jgi:HEAT repeat protein